MQLTLLALNNLQNGKQLALNNCLYLSVQMIKNSQEIIHVKINNKIIKTMFSSKINDKQIGAAKNLRDFLKLSNNNPVQVQLIRQPFKPSIDGMTQMVIELSERKNSQALSEQAKKNSINFLKNFEVNTILNLNQSFYISVNQVIYEGFVKQIRVAGKQKQYGLLLQNTNIQIVTPEGESSTGSSMVSQQGNTWKGGFSLFKPDFTPEKMGIGGLDNEVFNIFRKTFASRMHADIEQVQHVKGILLYGPPGTGKTLIARSLANSLNVNPKNFQIVNGPQVFNKFVGQSEQNIRKLFIQAKQDQKKYGKQSPLHIIVFDQIDAICKQRGHYSSGTNVQDQVVNQLLSNMDGVQALNNIIIIGMTNRKDLIDPAILRPGRLEVHVQIGLPNQKGRLQILKIHTAKLRQNNLLHSNCNLSDIAQLTKNYTGAEIESLVKSAVSFAIARSTNVMDFSAKLKIDQSKLKVEKGDFIKGMEQVTPQFGIDEEKFDLYFEDDLVNYGGSFQQVTNQITSSMKLQQFNYSQVKSILLKGKSGSGTTSFAVSFARHCNFSYTKIISPDAFVFNTEGAKVQTIVKIFENAYKTTQACIVIDNIPELIQYTTQNQRYSTAVLQILKTVITKPPPNNITKLLVIGTTSHSSRMQQFGIPECFSTKILVPELTQSQIASFLQKKYKIDQNISNVIAKNIKGVTIGGIIHVAGLVNNLNDPKEWRELYVSLVQDGQKKYVEDFDQN